ncbi:hypothetical protein ACUSIJ_24960 [Pseudochelatococcus sp. B33]
MVAIMRVALSGPDHSLQRGDLHEFPDDEAQRLIAEGFADPLSSMPVTPDPEQTPAEES